jgi:hypothetical protein
MDVTPGRTETTSPTRKQPKPEPADRTTRAMICHVCGRMSDFRIVETGPSHERLECAHCHAQRLETPRQT